MARNARTEWAVDTFTHQATAQLIWTTLNLLHCTNIRISMHTLWQVFHILTEPVSYTFISINLHDNKASRPTLQCGYMDIFYSVMPWFYVQLSHAFLCNNCTFILDVVHVQLLHATRCNNYRCCNAFNYYTVLYAITVQLLHSNCMQ